jgi:hypothetical protein
LFSPNVRSSARPRGGCVDRGQAARVAILYVGEVDDDIQQEAERIDGNMPITARDLFARIKALRAERGNPF